MPSSTISWLQPQDHRPLLLVCRPSLSPTLRVFISSILHHQPALLYRHMLIPHRRWPNLTFLVAFSVVVSNLSFSQSFPHNCLSNADLLELWPLVVWRVNDIRDEVSDRWVDLSDVQLCYYLKVTLIWLISTYQHHIIHAYTGFEGLKLWKFISSQNDRKHPKRKAYKIHKMHAVAHYTNAILQYVQINFQHGYLAGAANSHTPMSATYLHGGDRL